MVFAICYLQVSGEYPDKIINRRHHHRRSKFGLWCCGVELVVTGRFVSAALDDGADGGLRYDTGEPEGVRDEDR